MKNLEPTTAEKQNIINALTPHEEESRQDRYLALHAKMKPLMDRQVEIRKNIADPNAVIELAEITDKLKTITDKIVNDVSETSN